MRSWLNEISRWLVNDLTDDLRLIYWPMTSPGHSLLGSVRTMGQCAQTECNYIVCGCYFKIKKKGGDLWGKKQVKHDAVKKVRINSKDVSRRFFLRQCWFLWFLPASFNQINPNRKHSEEINVASSILNVHLPSTQQLKECFQLFLTLGQPAEWIPDL